MNRLPEEGIPIDRLMLPGSVDLTDAAWVHAKYESDVLCRNDPHLIAGFCHFTMTRYQPGPDQPFVQLGPSIEVGAYRRDGVPPEAVCTKYDFEFIVVIAKEQFAEKPQRLIDWSEDEGAGGFVIR